MLDTTTEAGGRAERRLREEQIIWMTTVRSDGQPQSVPVWFFWDGEEFLVYSQPGRQKLRNIERTPQSASTSTPTRRAATWCVPRARPR
jgi:PPOX class probable F420-dependent enzyme